MKKAGACFMTDIRDWFNCANTDHVEAFKHYKKTRAWPQGFLPSEVWLGPNWEKVLDEAITNAGYGCLNKNIQPQGDGCVTLKDFLGKTLVRIERSGFETIHFHFEGGSVLVIKDEGNDLAMFSETEKEVVVKQKELVRL